MDCNDFINFFYKQNNKEYFRSSGEGGTNIKEWIKGDKDEKFLTFTRFIERCHYKSKTELYKQTIEHIIKTYNSMAKSNDLPKDSPIAFEIKRLECRSALLGDNDGEREYAKKITDWLRVCLNLSDNKDIKFYFEVSELERENEIKNVLFKEGKNLRSFFINRVGKNYLPLIFNWFLKRYDLVTSRKLIKQLRKNEKIKLYPALRCFLISMGSNIRSLALFLAFVTLMIVLVFSFHNLYIKQEIVAPLLAIFKNLHLSCDIQLYVTLSVSAYLIAFIFFTLSIFSHWHFRLLLPRLLGGIVVGYLPLLMGDEAWTMIHNLPELNGCILFAISILFSGFYLYMEVKNTVSDSAEAFFRSLTVLLIGLFESFFLGLLVLDLITDSIKHDLILQLLQIDRGLVQVGLFGHIYPKLLVIYFPLALLVGIFVQIIWEDKPITQPL